MEKYQLFFWFSVIFYEIFVAKHSLVTPVTKNEKQEINMKN